MSAKGLESIESTVQLTHEWVNDLNGRLDWSSPKDALRLLRAVLTTPRDHLSHEEAAQFAAQLPLLIRGMYYEGWKPAATPLRDRDLGRFVAAVEQGVSGTLDYRGSEDIVTVFKMLNIRVSRGEIADARAALPEAIRRLWPEP
jgi:uncharacterized protein (DUF2267 family)